MKYCAAIFALLFCISGALYAQPAADSLRRLILPATDDTLKVRRLTELAKTLTDASKYDSAQAIAQWANTLIERLKDEKGRADALLELGRAYHLQSKNSSAMEYYSQSLAIAERIGYKQGMADALNNTGRLYADQSQYLQALERCLKGLKIREELNDKRGIARSLNDVGMIYFFQNQYQQASEYYERGFKISEELGDKRGMSSSLLNIGDIYLYDSQHRYSLALEYYRKGLVLKTEMGSKRGVAISLACIGSTFTALERYDSAFFYHSQAYAVATEVNDIIWAAVAQHGIALILTKQAKYTQALPKAQEALQLRIQSGERKEASETYALLATIHAALGNYKAAYDAQTQHHTLKDSLFNADNAKRLTALQASYDAQKQADEQKLRAAEARYAAERATQERERQTQLQYAAIAGVVLLTLALALAGRRLSAESEWGRRFGRFVSFAAVVMLVEFALLFLDPWLDRITGNTPLWRMAANVGIAVVIAPLHGLVEARLRASRVEKSAMDSAIS